MRKTFTFLILLLLAATTVTAGPITPERAYELANSFWSSNTQLRRNVKLQLKPGLQMSKATNRQATPQGDASYYIFSNDDEKGFIIVSGDDRLTPVIGYSDNCDVTDIPESLAMMLDDYSKYVSEVRAGTAEPINTATTSTTEIAPMLTTSWNQSAPYNNYCPTINGSRTPTGCTATAMAQIMNFHEWPASPKKAISWDNNITGKPETIDITKHTYEWDKMLDHYRGGYTQEQANAVAQLMIDVGKAIQSSYDLSGTGSSNIYAARALVNVFDYSPEIKNMYRQEHTREEFMTAIIENLAARQPVMFCGHGQSYNSGHAFVCDGIDKNSFLHIDWGWDGAFNGYFDIGSMSPGGSGIGGGEERYNVGEVIIVNIRPRSEGESDRNGDPTVYSYDILNRNNVPVEEYTVDFTNGTAYFNILTTCLNWSHSTVRTNIGIGITSVDGSYKRIQLNTTIQDLAFNRAVSSSHTVRVNNTTPGSVDYLAQGTYYVKLYYKDSDGNEVPMRGENNCITLEVGANSIKAYKTLPQVEVTGLEFREKPMLPNDKMIFDAAFNNKNKNNATIAIVPIVNRSGNNTVYSDTLINNCVLINTVDDTDLIATFNVGNNFPVAGDYYITFAYALRNSYTDHSTSVNKGTLKSIEGRSQTITIEELPTTANPIVTSISSNGATVGNTLDIKASIYNATSADSPYNGTFGLFAKVGEEDVLLTTVNVTNLRQNATYTLQYSSTSYFPKVKAGTHEVFVCEKKNDEWVRIKHKGYSTFTLQEPTQCMLYVANRLDIGNGNVVRRGDSVDVVTKVSAIYGDFSGYIRVNLTVKNSITMVLRSSYIPVNLKDGETVEINLRSLVGTSAPLGEWEINIPYYDNNKRQLGTVSTNASTYPDNGKFYVHDATAIETTTESDVRISTANGAITIANTKEESIISVYSIDGRTIYRGAATTVTADPGLYIVTVEAPEQDITTQKVLVK